MEPQREIYPNQFAKNLTILSQILQLATLVGNSNKWVNDENVKKSTIDQENPAALLYL
jgi:hypothetical protein